MDRQTIDDKIKEFSKLIEYPAEKIKTLKQAMKSELISKDIKKHKNKEYSNEVLAIVGDSILKFFICEKYKNSGIKEKGEIDKYKRKYEKNKVLYLVMKNEGWINYAYNNKCFYSNNAIKSNEKPVFPKHDAYLEAIIAAAYYDTNKNYNKVKKWINDFLFPKLEKASKDVEVNKEAQIKQKNNDK